MSEQTSGLRFDIYERVHLTDEQPDMKSLDSIELVPLIEVTAEGDQAQLKGNLLLTGQYFSDNDNETRSLEYWIPVEITLPLNRVQRIEDIAVEIENFDIDLLSSRLLNVSGVLSLRGFDTLPVGRDWAEEASVYNQEALIDRKPKVAPAPVEPKPETYVGYDTLSGDGTWLESMEAAEAAQATQAAQAIEAINNQESIWAQEQQTTFENEYLIPEPLIVPPASPVIPALPEDKKGLKVGFGSKPSSAKDHLQNIKNLMQDADGKPNTKLYRDQDSGKEASREGIRGDELEWQKLFLGERGNERSFQKVRLCIVQKEETIDNIAKRYSINPREIMQFNHLNDYQIAAGQVIYIPS